MCKPHTCWAHTRVRMCTSGQSSLCRSIQDLCFSLIPLKKQGFDHVQPPTHFPVPSPSSLRVELLPVAAWFGKELRTSRLAPSPGWALESSPWGEQTDEGLQRGTERHISLWIYLLGRSLLGWSWCAPLGAPQPG